MPHNLTLGVDVGGTWLRAAAVGGAGRIVRLERTALPPDVDPPAFAAALGELFRRLCASRECSALESDSAPAGLAVPGIRDADGSVLLRAVNLPRLEGCDIAALARSVLGRNVVVESDINAATWAQWRATDSPAQRFAYLSIGTGIAAGVVVSGRLVRHTNGGAGHLGFLVVDTRPDAPTDAAGIRGSASALLTAARTAGFEPGHPACADLARGLAGLLSAILHVYAPQQIALGGGVIEHEPWLVPRTESHFDAIRGRLLDRPIISPGALPTDEAGVVGAAQLAREPGQGGAPTKSQRVAP